jgi:ATP-dependent Lon protease
MISNENKNLDIFNNIVTRSRSNSEAVISEKKIPKKIKKDTKLNIRTSQRIKNSTQIYYDDDDISELSYDDNYDDDDDSLEILEPFSKKRCYKSHFQKKCNIYNLPNNLINITTDTNLINVYEKVKKYLIESQIDLSDILSLNNILDLERAQIIEKYSLMINSSNDLSTYIKIRNELKEMITYYSNSDMNQRKRNMNKKIQLDNITINTSELENKILNMFSNSTLTDQNQEKNNLYIQGLIYQKFKKLSNISPVDSEYYKLKEWLDTVVRIPFHINSINMKKENISQILVKIKQGLDAELYGMDKVKEELLMAINQRFINPDKADTSIALVGPPGVGKTKIINVLANLLSCSWEHISMGGINDSSFLAGHSYTYEGAKPGQLTNALIKMKCKDGIIFFDEIDKIADTSNGKEVSNQLLHITDFTQNNHFCDKYIPELPIDLSKIWFIFSLNSIASIDPILSNRFNYIYVDGYTKEEKLIICKEHLLKKAFDKYKLSNKKYIFDDIILNKIIDFSIKRENTYQNINTDNISNTGIRELKRSLDHIFNRLSLLENIDNKKEYPTLNIIESLSFYPKYMKIKNISKLKITEELIDNFLS